jgi:hypothetical protein
MPPRQAGGQPASSHLRSEFYVKIQVVGTPDDCLQRLAELHRLTGLDHLATEFGFGGMPHEQAELNMRLFADRVMPGLTRPLRSPNAGPAIVALSPGTSGLVSRLSLLRAPDVPPSPRVSR